MARCQMCGRMTHLYPLLHAESEVSLMFANLNISQKLYAGFGVVLLIILVLVLSTWRGFGQVERSVRLNIHTYDVIIESTDLLASLINIETGARGFAITGRDQFLEPLRAGQKDFEVHLADLRQLTRDNPAQQRRFAELQSAYEQAKPSRLALSRR